MEVRERETNSGKEGTSNGRGDIVCCSGDRERQGLVRWRGCGPVDTVAGAGGAGGRDPTPGTRVLSTTVDPFHQLWLSRRSGTSSQGKQGHPPGHLLKHAVEPVVFARQAKDTKNKERQLKAKTQAWKSCVFITDKSH